MEEDDEQKDSIRIMAFKFTTPNPTATTVRSENIWTLKPISRQILLDSINSESDPTLSKVVTTTPTTTTAGPYSHAGDNVTVIGDGNVPFYWTCSSLYSISSSIIIFSNFTEKPGCACVPDFFIGLSRAPLERAKWISWFLCFLFCNFHYFLNLYNLYKPLIEDFYHDEYSGGDL